MNSATKSGCLRGIGLIVVGLLFSVIFFALALVLGLGVFTAAVGPIAVGIILIVKATSRAGRPGNLFEQGVMNSELGNWKGAIEDYTRVIEVDPQCLAAYNNRADAYNNQGAYEKAIADCTKAMELDRKCIQAYKNRGIAKSAKGDHEGAIADYLRAIELNPKDAGAHFGLCVARTDCGDADGAIAEFTRAIALNPKNPEFAEAYCKALYLIPVPHRQAVYEYADFQKALTSISAGRDPIKTEILRGGLYEWLKLKPKPDANGPSGALETLQSEIEALESERPGPKPEQDQKIQNMSSRDDRVPGPNEAIDPHTSEQLLQNFPPPLVIEVEKPFPDPAYRLLVLKELRDAVSSDSSKLEILAALQASINLNSRKGMDVMPEPERQRSKEALRQLRNAMEADPAKLRAALAEIDAIAKDPAKLKAVLAEGTAESRVERGDQSR